jgi:hypothetical protein
MISKNGIRVGLFHLEVQHLIFLLVIAKRILGQNLLKMLCGSGFPAAIINYVARRIAAGKPLLQK